MKNRFVLLLALMFALSVQAAESGKKLFLWRVKSEKATAYLLGSLHVAKPEMYPLAEQIEKAFRESDTLVVEADMSPDRAAAAALKLMMRATYPAGDSLDKHISKATLDAVVAKSGVPEAQMMMMKPWFLATAMTLGELQKLGVDPQYGVDVHFLEAAKGKSIVELEGAEAQIDLLDSFTDKEQEEFLKYTIKDNDNMGKIINELITAWNTGDVKKVEDFLEDAAKDSPDMQSLNRRLFDERNKKMAAKIEAMLKTGKTYFIIVGAGHVVGKTGLLQLLAKTTHVEQVTR